MHNSQENSDWDALASQLGLEPAPKPEPPALPEASAPETIAPAAEPVVREEVVEVIPAHITEIEMKVTSIQDEVEGPTFGEGVVEDAADVLDDEAPEAAEGTVEEARADGEGEGEGKGRRRRRRRRRKKGGAETTAAESAETPIGDIEAVAEPEVIGFDPEEDVEVIDAESPVEAFGEGVPDADLDDEDEEVEEIVPDVAIAEEEDSTEPLPEWKVTAWTDLIGTLYRPQDR